jgi:hypothetical protein
VQDAYTIQSTLLCVFVEQNSWHASVTRYYAPYSESGEGSVCSRNFIPAHIVNRTVKRDSVEKEKRLAALREAYSRGLTSAARAAISSLLVILVLTAVAEQGLRASEHRRNSENRKQLAAFDQMNREGESLRHDYMDFRGYLLPRAIRYGMRVETSGAIPQTPDSAAFYNLQRRLDTLDVRTPTDTVHSQFRKVFNSRHTEYLASIRRYRQAALDYDSAVARGGRIHPPESIPTPFGTFELAPSLVLFGLFFASVLAHLVFTKSLRTQRLVAIAYTAEQGTQPVNWPFSAPFWAHSLHANAVRAFGSGSLSSAWVVPATALHAMWLLFSVVLLREARNWGVLQELDLPWPAAWFFLGEILLVGTAVYAANFLFHDPVAAALRWLHLSFPAPRSRARRRFVASLAVLVPASVVLALRFFRGAVAARATGPVARGVDFGSKTRGWIANRKTGVLHHELYCLGHLPAEANRSTGPSAVGAPLHRTYQVLILEAEAKRARDERRYDDAARLYTEAIQLSPFSFHLYDAVTKIYGQQRRYEETARLLHGALDRVEPAAELLRLNPTRRMSQVARAKKEFTTRLTKLRSREPVKA